MAKNKYKRVLLKLSGESFCKPGQFGIDGAQLKSISERIRKICSELKIKVYAPLWNYSAEQLWRELLDKKFKVIITKIASEGIPSSFLGKIINEKLLSELKKMSERYKFRLDFEGGDAETSVLFMPGFRKEIGIEYDLESEGNYRHFLKLKQVYENQE